MSAMSGPESIYGVVDDADEPSIEEVVGAHVQRIFVAENLKLIPMVKATLVEEQQKLFVDLQASLQASLEAENVKLFAKLEAQIPAYVQEGVQQAIEAMRLQTPAPVEKKSYRKFFAFMMALVVMGFILSQVPVNVKLNSVTNVTHVTYVTTNVTHYTRVTYVATNIPSTPRVTEWVLKPSIEEPDYQCPVTEPVTESFTNTTSHEGPVTTTIKDDISAFDKRLYVGVMIMGPTIGSYAAAIVALPYAGSTP
jgi:hypothetical protein